MDRNNFYEKLKTEMILNSNLDRFACEILIAVAQNEEIKKLFFENIDKLNISKENLKVIKDYCNNISFFKIVSNKNERKIVYIDDKNPKEYIIELIKGEINND